MRRGMRWLGVFGALVLAASCQGNIGDGADGGPPGACEVGPGHRGLQRLTRDEYNQTVTDLFGITTDPADAFPPDSATDGFDNNAKSLTTSPQLASLLLTAAESVAAEAMATRSAEIITCDPVAEACLRTVLSDLALRVYRRPVEPVELDQLVTLVADAQAEGETIEGGIEHALAAMLVAPQFLYRGIPIQAPPEGASVRKLDDFALATRLSYFLWGSTPDDELLAAAQRGDLSSELRSQFDRMLADPKADALYTSFVRQWLQLGKLASATPDPTLYPEFDEQLRAEMEEEVHRFFDDLRTRDASPLEIITSQATFAGAGLAGIYGVSGPAGDALEPVTTDPDQRAGILTMPAILTMTSNPTEPNIVRRGVWLSEAILCVKPPPPPPGVNLELPDAPGLSERERLERHRSDPSCASCHALIDPLGFGFEHYDALGHYRTEAHGEPVDAVGQLPDGRPFDGMVELSSMLTEDADFARCLTQKVATYALGRTLASEEACVVAGIAAAEVSPESRLSDLLWAIVKSEAFQSEAVQ